MTDCVLLETITAWYPIPYRQFYTRCWGCGKRRFFAEWYEGYQLAEEEANKWGWFCAPCIMVVVSQTVDDLHRKINGLTADLAFVEKLSKIEHFARDLSSGH